MKGPFPFDPFGEPSAVPSVEEKCSAEGSHEPSHESYFYLNVQMNLQMNLFLHMKHQKRLKVRVHEDWDPSSLISQCTTCLKCFSCDDNHILTVIFLRLPCKFLFLYGAIFGI